MSISVAKYLKGRYTVDPVTGCWLWSLQKSSKGYAQAKFEHKTWRVSRLLFHLAGEPLLPYPQEQALHNCDNTSCVNPSHIRRGTQKENVKDALSRKRWFSDKITHCPQGHEYTLDNIYWGRGRYRKCRICVLAREKEKYARSR